MPPQSAEILKQFAKENKAVHKKIATKVMELAQQLRNNENFALASFAKLGLVS